MPTPKVTHVRGDDWEGLYIDGRCVSQDHSLDWPRVIQDHLGIQVDTKYADLDWLDDRGSLPADIAEVKEGA